MREEDPLEHVIRVSAAGRRKGRGEVTECVDGENRRLVEWRDEERTRDVCLMVFDLMRLGVKRVRLESERLGQSRADIALLSRAVEGRFQIARAGAMANGPQEVVADVCAPIARHGDVIELLGV